MQESPIFVRTYDLLQWLIQVTQHFPRSQRFVLAQRVQAAGFNLQEALLEAGLHRGAARHTSLERADIELAKVRFYLRLSTDLHWLSMHQYEHASRMVDEVGRLLGGWSRKEREAQTSA